MSISALHGVTGHLKRCHPESWAAYGHEKMVADVASKMAKKEKHENGELEAATDIRLFNIRTNGGRLPFLRQVHSSHFSYLLPPLFHP